MAEKTLQGVPQSSLIPHSLSWTTSQGDVLSQGVAFFFLFLIRGYPGTELLSLFRMLPMCGYTAVMAAPAFFAVRRAHLWFQKKILPEGT